MSEPETSPPLRSRAPAGRGRGVAVTLGVVLVVVLVVVQATRGGGPGCGGEQPAGVAGGHWTCTFDDEFTGSSLDGSRWTPLSGPVSLAGSPPECRVGANVAVSGGVLRLTARRETTPASCPGPGGAVQTSYTAGGVSTGRKFAQTYGRVEIRAAFPDVRVPGLHSALWLYPQALDYGPWPRSGEIDIAEFRTSLPDRVIPFLHYDTGSLRAGESNAQCLVSDPGAFHDYVLEWTAAAIRISYDGRPCLTTSWQPAPPLRHPAPFDRPFYLVLNQSLGVRGNAVGPSTPLPATMRVDYVRAWRFAR